MKRHIPKFSDLRLLSAITALYPRATSQIVSRRVKAGAIDRWTLKEVTEMFPQNKLADTGWVEGGALNVYFYDRSQVVAALEPTGLFEPIAPKMAPRAKEKLRLGLTAAYNDGIVPSAAHGLLLKAKEWSGAFQRNITLTNAEVALFDAITRRMRGERSTLVSWVGMFKRFVGHFIVAVHPAMVDLDYKAYFAWVNGPKFDLLTLVGSLGYDDLDDFAAQLMLPIEAARHPNSYQHKQNLWDALGKTDLPDPSHPLYAPLCSLKVQVAEGAADAVIGKETGIPQFRDAVEMMAMIRGSVESSLDLHEVMSTIAILNEHGFEFVNGQITVTDHDKALTFRDSLRPALEDSFARRQKEKATV